MNTESVLNEVFAESDLTLDGMCACCLSIKLHVTNTQTVHAFVCQLSQCVQVFILLAEDCENNLKLYVDTQQGGTVMTGHELADRWVGVQPCNVKIYSMMQEEIQTN